MYGNVLPSSTYSMLGVRLSSIHPPVCPNGPSPQTVCGPCFSPFLINVSTASSFIDWHPVSCLSTTFLYDTFIPLPLIKVLLYRSIIFCIEKSLWSFAIIFMWHFYKHQKKEAMLNIFNYTSLWMLMFASCCVLCAFNLFCLNYGIHRGSQVGQALGNSLMRSKKNSVCYISPKNALVYRVQTNATRYRVIVLPKLHTPPTLRVVYFDFCLKRFFFLGSGVRLSTWCQTFLLQSARSNEPVGKFLDSSLL